MLAKSSPLQDQIAQVNRAVLAHFMAAGYERIRLPLLQPAGDFLNLLGENLRNQAYVFKDPGGNELCLRPDLTMPAARIYLERQGIDSAQARYCYDGAVYRYHGARGDQADHTDDRFDLASTAERCQTGIESYAVDDHEKEEARTVVTILDALAEQGLTEYRLRIGDLQLFHAFLDRIDMPARWRRRLKQQFWRKCPALKKMLHSLAQTPPCGPVKPCGELLPCLDLAARDKNFDLVVEFLEQKGIPIIGTRSIEDIVARLEEMAEDARAEPLSAEIVDVIEEFLAIKAPPRAAIARIKDLATAAGLDLGAALKSYERRLKLLSKNGVSLRAAEFDAQFGRDLEYYTGFVFQVEMPDDSGAFVAGGGRYDMLLRQIGAGQDIAAVGAVIHPRRLVRALYGDVEG